MASTIISSQPQYTFGVMTSRAMSGLVQANTSMERLKTAVATASSGTADDGTQFEVANTTGTVGNNLFGIVADPTKPGQKGKDYQYAINSLSDPWRTFWEEAKPFVEQLDQGTMIY